MLIAFAGLPGTGKTTLARLLARHLHATYLRIDTIEQAIVQSEIAAHADTAGYLTAYAIAADNLALGGIVVADSVNALALTRDAWLEAAKQSGVPLIEIEVLCSDPEEHRHRIESRRSDISGLKLPTWQQVQNRSYEPWSRTPIRIDTAHLTIDQSFAQLLRLLPPVPNTLPDRQ